MVLYLYILPNSTLLVLRLAIQSKMCVLHRWIQSRNLKQVLSCNLVKELDSPPSCAIVPIVVNLLSLMQGKPTAKLLKFKCWKDNGVHYNLYLENYLHLTIDCIWYDCCSTCLLALPIDLFNLAFLNWKPPCMELIFT